MKRFSSLLLVAVVAFGLTLTGCDSGSSSTEGSMDVTMTESSSSSTTASKSTSKSHIGNVSEALVTFSEVTAAPEGSEDDERSVSTENVDVDLMKLNQGIDRTITDLSIPEGTYGQIRLKAGDQAVQLTFDNGTQNTARIASNEIKLNFSPAFTVESPDDRVEVTVDWNVENSLEGQKGSTDLTQSNLVITPVVQAEATVTSATSDDDSN
jgi:hypothetical protein